MIVAQLFKKYHLPFMEPEDLLLVFSQEPATGSHPKPDEPISFSATQV
jgi:hypothetical protein